MNTVYIHTNNKQKFGALLSKYSVERALKDKGAVSVQLINVDELPVFKAFAHKEYLRGGKPTVYNPEDLQSFTLSRFMPPELMNYEGKAIVIDPDIFTRVDIQELFAIDMEGKAIACCTKKTAFDSSMMLMDCSKLKHWRMADILERLANKSLDYSQIMSLNTEPVDTIKTVPRIWNNLDTLTPDTKLIHMTERLTQPWKTGLKIDFTRNKMPKVFGIIPREWIHRIKGTYATTYQKHPNPEIEAFFFTLVKDALKDGAITKEDVQRQIDQKNIRSDMFKKLETA